MKKLFNGRRFVALVISAIMSLALLASGIAVIIGNNKPNNVSADWTPEIGTYTFVESEVTYEDSIKDPAGNAYSDKFYQRSVLSRSIYRRSHLSRSIYQRSFFSFYKGKC